jgi:hypothetical protein
VVDCPPGCLIQQCLGGNWQVQSGTADVRHSSRYTQQIDTSTQHPTRLIASSWCGPPPSGLAGVEPLRSPHEAAAAGPRHQALPMLLLLPSA